MMAFQFSLELNRYGEQTVILRSHHTIEWRYNL